VVLLRHWVEKLTIENFITSATSEFKCFRIAHYCSYRHENTAACLQNLHRRLGTGFFSNQAFFIFVSIFKTLDSHD